MKRNSHLAGDLSGDFARFMALTACNDDPASCWEWQGNRPGGRYGHFSVGGKTVKAHRWIYETLHGPIEDGLVLRHHCDNPRCVNPLHLEPGTHQENRMDCVRRGRVPNRQGVLHPLRKLDENDIRVIRRRAACGESHARISKDYPVGRGQIDKIVNRQNWSHVE